MLSKQIQLIGIIIKRQIELEQSQIFSEKLKQIKPGPDAHRKIYNILGYKKNKYLKNLSIDGVVVEDDLQKLDELKTYFSNIYSGSTPQRDVTNELEIVNGTISNVEDNLFNFNNNFSALNEGKCVGLVTLDELQNYVKIINNKKSSGLDNISNFIIKKLPVKALEYLTIVFNNCVNNSYFPNAWKISKIIPIQKKPNNIEINNLRPISLLSNLGKLLERVLRNKMDIGVREPYIQDLQFGFKKGHSTVDAMLKFQDDVVNHLRVQQCTVAVLLDVEKAFDHTYHNGILFKMIQIGFDPSMVKMFNSFLTNRVFCVQFKNSITSFGDVNCGVPQGSILAPHIYNIFMHDFPHLTTNSVGLLYADDTLLYSHSESPTTALRQVSDHLVEVKSFYDHWGIKLNASKCEAICLRNASGKCRGFVVPESKRLKLFLDGTEICFKDNIKYLGITFDKLLKFNKHARKVISKSYQIMGSFGKILGNKNLSQNSKILLYKTSIRPVILYGFPIWFNVSPIIIKEMEILERKILRNCIGKHFQSFSKRYSNRFIYSEAKVTPIGLYVCDILNRFVERSEVHENKFIKDVFNNQKDLNWSNTNYLSPISYINELPPNFDLAVSLRHTFYSKSVPGTHRG